VVGECLPMSLEATTYWEEAFSGMDYPRCLKCGGATRVDDRGKAVCPECGWTQAENDLKKWTALRQRISDESQGRS
jgi:hypothetical protein